MPNMFGGDQNHPAYNPNFKPGPNEVVYNDLLYTYEGPGKIKVTRVDGSYDFLTIADAPSVVRKKFTAK